MIARSIDAVPCITAWSIFLAIPLALIVGIGWPWLQSTAQLRGEIQDLDDKISHYHRLMQTLPVLQDQLEQLRSNKQIKGFFFEAKTPALAGAQVQRLLQRMVESAGGRVVSTQVLQSYEDEQPPTVRVRTQIQGRTDVLLDVLYDLEQARPFLFVEKITIRAPAQRRSFYPDSTTMKRLARRWPHRQQLQIRLDVFGYALGENP